MLPAIFGELLLGWLLADLLGGIFHWYEDRVASERTPLIGKHVVYYNRIHHRNPGASLLGGFWYRNGSAILASLVVSAIMVWLIGVGPFVISFAVGFTISTQVHYWAHHPPQNRFIRVLQDVGILQSPKHHSSHHGGNQDTKYCVLTNYLNPILDSLKIWHAAEYLMARIGFKPSLGRY